MGYHCVCPVYMVLMGSVAAVALLKLKLGHFDKELPGLDELM